MDTFDLSDSGPPNPHGVDHRSVVEAQQEGEKPSNPYRKMLTFYSDPVDPHGHIEAEGSNGGVGTGQTD